MLEFAELDRPGMATMQAPGKLGLLLVLCLCGCGGAPEEDFEPIAAALALTPGATVADIGTGDGDFLPFYASLVGGEGLVYGTELDPQLVEDLKARVAIGGLANVRVLEAGVDATGLPPGCCDAVVLRHVYHHLTAPVAILRDVWRALLPGGRLLVIDFRPTPLLAPFTPDDLPEGHSGHGVTPELIASEGASAGFRMVSVEEDWPGSHLFMDRFAVLLAK